MKRFLSTALSLLAVFGVAFTVVLAVTTFFEQQHSNIGVPDVHVFQFELITNTLVESSGGIGPGDSFEIKPVIENTSTEEMYVFLQIDMPCFEGQGIYTYEVNSIWHVVSETVASSALSVVYAYGYEDDCMYSLPPGEFTDFLTEKMTMISITYPEYASIDDKSFDVRAYAIGTEGVSTNPADAWNDCKAIGNIQ